MAKRLGAVISFKPGVTKAAAARAIAQLAEVLDLPKTTGRTVSVGERKCKFVEVPFEPSHLVHEYDDEYGGPVWYIP